MDFGVSLFFVLSGFLLYRPYARHVAAGARPISVRIYALRRSARLLPAWLLVLVGTLFLVPASRTAGRVPWTANLAQLQSLRVEWDLPGLAQLWSLSTEVMFYVALPLVAASIARIAAPRGPRTHLLALGLVAAGSVAFQLIAVAGGLPDGFAWLRTLPAMGDWFVVGMALAAVVTDSRMSGRITLVVQAVPWHLYAIAACVFWVLTTRIAGPYDLTPPTGWEALTKHLGYGVVAALIIAPSAFGAKTKVSRFLSWRLMTYLGAISYGLFLWHLPIMLWARNVLGLPDFGGGFWATVTVTLGLSIVVASGSWHLLEAPTQTWVRRRTGSPERGGATLPPSGRNGEHQQGQRA
jgi:peptidoglycan/LPS O-acetylase OafA/YrhL